MNIAVLGTGMVGTTIASRLIELGHRVTLGSRTRTNEAAVAWAQEHGDAARCGTFADAAADGELVFNCTAGAHSIEALRAAGADNLRGKVLIDVANPLDFSKGMPPTLSIFNDDSLGESIQRTFPEARVVKALNTMNCEIMVDPSRVAGDHDVFVSGDEAEAKAQVVELLKSFGWKQPIDLGDLSTARGTESFLPLWLRLWGALGTPDFNIKVVRS